MRNQKPINLIIKKKAISSQKHGCFKKKEISDKFVKDKSYLESAELSLSVVSIEYQAENERSNTLTTRSGVLLSVMVLAATFILQNIEFDLLLRANSILVSSCRYCAFVLSTVLSLLCVLASMILLIISVITKSYERIDCTHLDNDKTLSYKKDKVAASIIKAYVNAICKNSQKNNAKAKLYNAGAILGIFGIVLAVMQRILQEI